MQNKSVLTNTLFFFNAVCDISRDKCILSTIFLDLDEIWQQLLMTRAGSEKGIDLAKVLMEANYITKIKSSKKSLRS